MIEPVSHRPVLSCLTLAGKVDAQASFWSHRLFFAGVERMLCLATM